MTSSSYIHARHMYCMNILGYGVIFTPGTRLLTNSAATSALGRPISLGLCYHDNSNLQTTQTINGPKQKLSIQV